MFTSTCVGDDFDILSQFAIWPEQLCTISAPLHALPSLNARHLQVARAEDLLAMSESGTGSVCVNAYGIPPPLPGQAALSLIVTLFRPKMIRSTCRPSLMSKSTLHDRTCFIALMQLPVPDLRHGQLVAGFSHDILTISKASNITLEGDPNTSCSWFSGYAWTIARCATCLSQMVTISDAQQ